MKSTKKICYIDLDGIFTSYPKCWLQYIEIKTGKHFDSLEIAKKRIPRDEYLNLKKDYRSSDFKFNLTPMEGSLDFTKSLHRKGYFTVIVTTRPEDFPRLKERTIEWLRKNNILYDELLFVKNKSDIIRKYPALSFGVDDEPDVCNTIAIRGYKMFLICKHNNISSNLYENVVVIKSFEDILRRIPITIINELDPWFYKLKIGNQFTKPGIGTNYDEEFLWNRQNNRKKLIIDSWATRENIKNKTVLDIGCNAGYWAYCLYRLGASKILGIEGRARFIRQAELFYRANNVKCDYKFINDNVADLSTFSSIVPHDIVICAGILYHIPNWEEVLYAVSNFTKEVLVVDTRILKENKYIQETPDYFNAIPESSKKRIPTKQKLLGILRDKFSELRVINPTFKDMKGLNGNDSYNHGKRLCIIAKKKSSKKKVSIKERLFRISGHNLYKIMKR